ncbi:CIC11C00000002722 [Sungouiella intermedia]|uniref:CIC11C00000002722 n=1 Tax=Sungouiella intermedia TaxID=45354 RepID=A0A1L0D2K7_9ASCO|nr:CIC11C00000002722 [[Candida] intermedia]
MALSVGVDPSTIRQLLLQHTFLPLISLQLTHNADLMFQQACQNSLILVLQAIQPYGNNAKHGVTGQAYKLTNTQLITRMYGLFPVRFEPLLPELLTVHNPSDSKLTGLFSISSLELILKKLSQSQDTSQKNPFSDLYLNMFRRVITSNKVVLFDTLNHPVSQIFVIDFENDSIEVLRQMIVEFRNFTFPKYFQMSDLLVHVFILYNANVSSESEVAKFQNDIRTNLTVTSTAVPMSLSEADTQFVRVAYDNVTIDCEVQKMSFQQGKATQEGDEDDLQIPRELDITLRGSIFEYISKFLIPHMERKIRTWDDLILSPKKSIASQFFSVSRKLFKSSGELVSQAHSVESYNSVHNYYHRSSPEQSIRKLADWSLMLKDFKYAYSTYDLIKKDYTNDKAWVYVAATQEMCIISLLLAQTQPLASDTLPQPPDKNTLRKIRHDIIEPYIDNLSYTFKSRFNVKTYAIKSYLVVAELLLNMSIMFNIPWWWSDLIESYYLKCMMEIDAHLASIGNGPQAIKAVLYERIGYSIGQFSYVPYGYRNLLASAFETEENENKEMEKEKDGTYVNVLKILPPKDNAIKGLTRFRKRSLWYILSMREWLKLENLQQVKSLVDDGVLQFNMKETTGEWYDRHDLILATIRASIGE